MNDYRKEQLQRLAKETNYLFILLDNYATNKGDRIKLNELRKGVNFYIKNYFNI